MSYVATYGWNYIVTAMILDLNGTSPLYQAPLAILVETSSYAEKGVCKVTKSHINVLHPISHNPTMGQKKGDPMAPFLLGKQH